jgi:hypothetical protein
MYHELDEKGVQIKNMFMMITNLKEETTRRIWVKIRETSCFRKMFIQLFLEKKSKIMCLVIQKTIHGWMMDKFSST